MKVALTGESTNVEKKGSGSWKGDRHWEIASTWFIQEVCNWRPCRCTGDGYGYGDRDRQDRGLMNATKEKKTPPQVSL